MSELRREQRTSLRQALEALRDQLQASLGLNDAGAKPVDLDEPIGRLSRMEAIQQQQMTAATRAGMGVRLEQVKQALVAIDTDAYGACRVCGEPIDLKRLTARPEVPLCLPCQSAREVR